MMAEEGKTMKSFLKRTRTLQLDTGLPEQPAVDQPARIQPEQHPVPEATIQSIYNTPRVNLNIFSDSFDSYYHENHAGNFKHPIAIPELYTPNQQIAVAGYTIPYKGWDNLELDDHVSWFDKIDERNYNLVGSDKVKAGNYNLRELIDAINIAMISVYERKIATCTHFDFEAVPFLKIENGRVKLQQGSYFSGDQKRFVQSVIRLGPLLSKLIDCNIDGMCNQLIHSGEEYEIKENKVDIDYPYKQIYIHSTLADEPLLRIPITALKVRNGKPTIVGLNWLDLKGFEFSKYTGPPEFWLTTEHTRTIEDHAIRNRQNNKISLRLKFRQI